MGWKEVVVVALAGLVGCAADPDVITDEAPLVSQAPPLRSDDFSRGLNKSFLRESNSYLSDDAFENKWSASTESAVMFMRAYPGGYHKDLGQIANGRVLGTEGLCFGDAHPDNFGFLQIGSKVEFVYNDLDDAGYCPVILDAARYFAVLRLYFDDKDLSRDTLERYVDALKDPDSVRKIGKKFVPNIQDARREKLDQLTRGNVLAIEDGLTPTDTRERSAIERLVASDSVFRNTRLLDVATMQRDQGGSGGLRRYWLLAETAGQRTIFELKEAAIPGTELGRHRKVLRAEERLGVLKSAFWGTDASADYNYVSLGGVRFLVRDRLAKKSIDLRALSKGDRADVVAAQASLLANLHRTALAPVGKDAIRDYVGESSDLLAKRWASMLPRR